MVPEAESEGLPTSTTSARRTSISAACRSTRRQSRARADDARIAFAHADRSDERATRTIETPKGATISGADLVAGRQAHRLHRELRRASHIYVADVATGKSAQITKTPLLAVRVQTTFSIGPPTARVSSRCWCPQPLRPSRSEPAIATSPKFVCTSDGKVAAGAHPCQSLLRDPHDKALLELLHDRPARGDRREDEGREEDRRAGDDHARSTASPDGQYFRVTLLTKPFSYIVPVVELRHGRAAVGRERQGGRESRRRRSAKARAANRADAAPRSRRGGRRRAIRTRASATSSGIRWPGPRVVGSPGRSIAGARAARAMARRGGRGAAAGGGAGGPARRAGDRPCSSRVDAAVRRERREGVYRGERAA